MLIVTLNRHSEINRSLAGHINTKCFGTPTANRVSTYWRRTVWGGCLKVAPSLLALCLIPTCQSLLKSKDTQQTSVSVVHSMNECLATLSGSGLNVLTTIGYHYILVQRFMFHLVQSSGQTLSYPVLWFIIKYLRNKWHSHLHQLYLMVCAKGLFAQQIVWCHSGKLTGVLMLHFTFCVLFAVSHWKWVVLTVIKRTLSGSRTASLATTSPSDQVTPIKLFSNTRSCETSQSCPCGGSHTAG